MNYKLTMSTVDQSCYVFHTLLKKNNAYSRDMPTSVWPDAAVFFLQLAFLLISTKQLHNSDCKHIEAPDFRSFVFTTKRLMFLQQYSQSM